MSSRFSVIFVLLSLSGITLFCGCNRTQFMVDSMNPLMVKMRQAMNKNDDIALVKDGSPASLLMLDGLLEASPNNKTLLAMAAEANSGYALAFLDEKYPERAKKLYYKSLHYALRSLNHNKAFVATLHKSYREFLPSLKQFGEDDVPGLYWASICWFQYIYMTMDNVDVLRDIPKVEAMLNRVMELNESYWYGFSHAVLGSKFAAQPQQFGGDIKKAKFHFDRAFQLSNSKLLLVHYLYAKFYAVQIQDRKLFVDTLQTIINAPDNLLPEKKFTNVIVKYKAKRLLENVDDYF